MNFNKIQKTRFFKKVHIIVVLAVILTFLLVHMVQAVTVDQTPKADSSVAQDVMVASPDYVDAKVNELAAKLNDMTTKVNDATAKVNEMTTRLNDVTAKLNEQTVKLNDTAAKLTDTAARLTDTAAKLSEANVKINELNGKVDNLNKQLEATKFTVIQVKAGKQLTAGGSAEIILRGGSAKAVGSKSGGLSDVITGQDIQTGANVPLNHLLIVPKDDGRGLKIVTDSWVMIKGTYTIK